jgi:hypothetical protein
MPALVALKNTCLQIFDGMRGSPSQMRIAAALGAADRSNESLLLDDEGSPFHSPAHSQYPRLACNREKRAELGQSCGQLWKT